MIQLANSCNNVLKSTITPLPGCFGLLLTDTKTDTIEAGWGFGEEQLEDSLDLTKQSQGFTFLFFSLASHN
jgi:hypothetical protein